MDDLNFDISDDNSSESDNQSYHEIFNKKVSIECLFHIFNLAEIKHL